MMVMSHALSRKLKNFTILTFNQRLEVAIFPSTMVFLVKYMLTLNFYANCHDDPLHNIAFLTVTLLVDDVQRTTNSKKEVSDIFDLAR